MTMKIALVAAPDSPISGELSGSLSTLGSVQRMSPDEVISKMGEDEYDLTVISSPGIGQPEQLMSKIGKRRKGPIAFVTPSATWIEGRQVLRAHNKAHYIPAPASGSALIEKLENIVRHSKSQSARGKAQILIADNDPDFLETRKDYLEKHGYSVVTATNPNDAQRMLRTMDLDAALLDIRLENDDDEKDTSGIQVLQIGRKLGIPGIILTSYPSTDTVRETLHQEKGEDTILEYLTKEEGPEEMLRVVRRILPIAEMGQFLLNIALPSGLLILILVTGLIALIWGNPSWLLASLFLALVYAILSWRLSIV